VCNSDIVLDGNTLPFGNHSFDVNQTSPTDVCPNVLVVEVQNADALFARGADTFVGHVAPDPMTEPDCERSFGLTTVFLDSAGNPVNDVQSSIGSWGTCAPPVCIRPCSNLPQHTVTPAEAAGHTVFFRAPAVPNARFTVAVGVGVVPE
jgi:hypothetical protein